LFKFTNLADGEHLDEACICQTDGKP